MSRYRRISLSAGLLAFAVLVTTSLYSITTTTPTMAGIDNLPVIILDSGHGGIDGGAVSASGIVEKDINLSICLKLRDMLEIQGFEVVMVRDTDRSIHDDGINGTRAQKTSDLKNRLAITEQYPNAVFISIHQNKFGDTRSNGAQVFYGVNHPASQELAEIMQAELAEKLQPDNDRQIKKAGTNLYLLTHAKCPAILVECGFLSNVLEAEKLNDPDYQAQIAFTAMCGLLEYLSLDYGVDELPPEPEAA